MFHLAKANKEWKGIKQGFVSAPGNITTTTTDTV